MQETVQIVLSEGCLEMAAIELEHLGLHLVQGQNMNVVRERAG